MFRLCALLMTVAVVAMGVFVVRAMFGLVLFDIFWVVGFVSAAAGIVVAVAAPEPTEPSRDDLMDALRADDCPGCPICHELPESAEAA